VGVRCKEERVREEEKEAWRWRIRCQWKRRPPLAGGARRRESGRVADGDEKGSGRREPRMRTVTDAKRIVNEE